MFDTNSIVICTAMTRSLVWTIRDTHARAGPSDPEGVSVLY